MFKFIKLLVCLMSATAAFNVHAVFIAELDESNYAWLELDTTRGVNQLSSGASVTSEGNAIYEYEYSSKELEKDLSHSYAPWYSSDEWHGANIMVNSARVTTDEAEAGSDASSSPSVKVLLLIISGLIGIVGLTKDRSHL